MLVKQLLLTTGVAAAQALTILPLPSTFAFQAQLVFERREPIQIGDTTVTTALVTNGTLRGPLLNATVTSGTIQFTITNTTRGPSVSVIDQVLLETDDGMPFSVVQMGTGTAKSNVARPILTIGEPYAYLADNSFACYSPANRTGNPSVADCYLLGEI